jgi:predicted protein tyrosine phosphatase
MSVIRTPYQSSYLKVLTVCSGGVLRSPTAATLLTQLQNFNCRSCGIEDYALVQISQSLVYWADVIVCAEDYHVNYVREVIANAYMLDEVRPTIYNLDIPDDFEYMQPELIELMKKKFKEFNLA